MIYILFMPGAYWYGPVCLSVMLAYGQEDLETRAGVCKTLCPQHLLAPKYECRNSTKYF